MCGRYEAFVEDEELLRIIEREKIGNVARYFRQKEVFPGTAFPVIYGSYATVRAHVSTWGFPIQKKGEKDNEKIRTNVRNNKEIILLNARAEEAENKPMFKDALHNSSRAARRILVLTSGYYEWQKEGDRHIRYHLFPDSPKTPLLLGGLEITLSEQDHRHLILTTAAAGSAEAIHPRMPLIIPRDQMRLWLYDTNFALKKLREKQRAELILRRCDQ